jgi:pilus assembly protein CpaB
MTDRTPLPLFQPRRPLPFAGLARAARWHRRKLAVLAAVGAVLCTLAAASPSERVSVPVVVAAADLDGGRALVDGDLRIARYPLDLAPRDAVADPGVLTGRHLITAAGAGTPLTERSVVAPRGLQPGAGQALVPVRLDDPAVAALLRVGDRVDVVASPADDSPARVIAAGARVLALPGSQQSGGPFGTSTDSRGPLVLLEVSSTEAGELVQAQTRHRLTVVLR